MANPQESAFDRARKTLEGWGLGTLAPTLLGLVKEGLDDNSLILRLRETKEYKLRFAGNEERRRKGLRVLDEAEYLSKEDALRSQLSDPRYGLPKSFYDSPADYARIIGADLGAGEIQGRLEAAKAVVTDGTMNGVLEYARSAYGLKTGDLIAYFMDPDKAAAILTRQARAAQIGAAGKRTGFGDVSAAEAERLDALGINADQAAAGFSQAADLGELAADLGDQAAVTKDDITKAVFDQDAKAKDRVVRAQETRRARFEGGGSFSESRTGFAGLGSANT